MDTLTQVRETGKTFYQSYGKRIFDVSAGLFLGVASLPVQCAVALGVQHYLGKPVIFRQTRPGLNGVSFQILKFRTMTDQRGPDGILLPDHLRLTPFGVFLRKTSLDELPEIVNVLRGDMSLVGPRPLLDEYLPLYTTRQQKRHSVRPGLTGLAQVSGRNNLDWDKRLELDALYADHCNLWSDLKILVKTVIHVAKRTGINMDGHATAVRFTGPSGAQAR